jgi:hypothetical protein
MKFNSRKVSDVQHICVMAYEKYADALDGLAEAKKSIKSLSESINSKQSAELARRQADAGRKIDITNHNLDMSQSLIEECSLKKENLKKQFLQNARK